MRWNVGAHARPWPVRDAECLCSWPGRGALDCLHKCCRHVCVFQIVCSELSAQAVGKEQAEARMKLSSMAPREIIERHFKCLAFCNTHNRRSHHALTHDGCAGGRREQSSSVTMWPSTLPTLRRRFGRSCARRGSGARSAHATSSLRRAAHFLAPSNLQDHNAHQLDPPCAQVAHQRMHLPGPPDARGSACTFCAALHQWRTFEACVEAGGRGPASGDAGRICLLSGGHPA